MAGISSVATNVPATTDGASSAARSAWSLDIWWRSSARAWTAPPRLDGPTRRPPMGFMTFPPCAERERNQPAVECVDDAGAAVPLARGASRRARRVGSPSRCSRPTVIAWRSRIKSVEDLQAFGAKGLVAAVTRFVRACSGSAGKAQRFGDAAIRVRPRLACLPARSTPGDPPQSPVSSPRPPSFAIDVAMGATCSATLQTTRFQLLFLGLVFWHEQDRPRTSIRSVARADAGRLVRS